MAAYSSAPFFVNAGFGIGGFTLIKDLQGTAREDSDRPRRVNQLEMPLAISLIAFTVANLIMAGSSVGFAENSESEMAAYCSTPFFANAVLGIGGLIINFQGNAREAHDSLSL
jgi:hypothetical protein